MSKKKIRVGKASVTAPRPKKSPGARITGGSPGGRLIVRK